MSWLNDLVDAGGQIVDKVLDYDLASAKIDAGIFGNEAQAADGTVAAPSVQYVQTSPLSDGGGFTQYLPWVAAGVGGLVLVYLIAKA